jgi:sugar phosphate isomerase/epimerase
MNARREFLKSLAASAAISAAARGVFAAGAPQVHFGCQTNAWPIIPNDFSSVLAVIRKIRDYGYEGFETGFANVQGQFENAAQAKRQIADLGMRFFGVHIFLTKYDPESNIAPPSLYERVAAGGAKLGAERLILSGAPPADDAGRGRKAQALNHAGEIAAKAGLKLAYHNHGAEVRNKGSEIEFLFRETNPDRVSFLLDAGHAFEGGADVPDLIRRHHSRILGMHLRDFKNGEQVPLGSGDFPLQAVVDVIRQTGWNGWVLNEEERLTSKPGDSAVKPARDTMFRAFGKGA